jgi:hypothetical protein
VTELTDLLGTAGRELEPEVRRRLGGMLGGIVRAYLPQVWEFRTDSGTASLSVSTSGAASVADGAATHPDVTIEIPLKLLHAALTSRRTDSVPAGAAHVTPHTTKGRAAFDYLRSRIGL